MGGGQARVATCVTSPALAPPPRTPLAHGFSELSLRCISPGLRRSRGSKRSESPVRGTRKRTPSVPSADERPGSSGSTESRLCPTPGLKLATPGARLRRRRRRRHAGPVITPLMTPLQPVPARFAVRGTLGARVPPTKTRKGRRARARLGGGRPCSRTRGRNRAKARGDLHDPAGPVGGGKLARGSRGGREGVRDGEGGGQPAEECAGGGRELGSDRDPDQGGGAVREPCTLAEHAAAHLFTPFSDSTPRTLTGARIGWSHIKGFPGSPGNHPPPPHPTPPRTRIVPPLVEIFIFEDAPMTQLHINASS